MRVEAYGSHHLDPHLQDAVERIAENSDILLVEGMPQEEQEKLNEALDLESDFGFDVNEDHTTEQQAAPDYENDIIYLDGGRSLEEQIEVCQDLHSIFSSNQIQEYLINGLDSENLPVFASELTGGNLHIAYNTMNDGYHEKSLSEAYEELIREKVSNQDEEWTEGHQIMVEGVGALLEANYETWDEAWQAVVNHVIGTEIMQEREKYWLEKINNASTEADEISVIAGLNHLYPVKGNFHEKLSKEGYQVDAQPLRMPKTDYRDSFLFNLHQ